MMMTSSISAFASSVESALLDFKSGKMLIVIDDHDRENEGDLIMAAQDVSSDDINFMASYGKGLICTPLSCKIAEKLELQVLESPYPPVHGTAFTMSIDAKGSGTGISTQDRANTIQALCSSETIASDLLRPGHIFPLIAKPGGVLERRGHTEASIDLCKLTQKKEVAVICEILNPDGSMARGSSLEKFAIDHKIKVISIDSIVKFLQNNQSI